MPIQIGFCNGRNHLLNAVEYHRDSELNYACTDLILLVGKVSDIGKDFTYDTKKMQAFFVKKGTLVEVYATTLHYAPISAETEPYLQRLSKGIRTGEGLTPIDDTHFAQYGALALDEEHATYYIRAFDPFEDGKPRYETGVFEVK